MRRACCAMMSDRTSTSNPPPRNYCRARHGTIRNTGIATRHGAVTADAPIGDTGVRSASGSDTGTGKSARIEDGRGGPLQIGRLAVIIRKLLTVSAILVLPAGETPFDALIPDERGVQAGFAEQTDWGFPRQIPAQTIAFEGVRIRDAFARDVRHGRQLFEIPYFLHAESPTASGHRKPLLRYRGAPATLPDAYRAH